MRTSTNIVEIGKALNKFQAGMKAVKNTEENPFFHSKYANLASIWEAIRKPLTDCGLAVIQDADGTDTVITVTTLLSHISGEWIECKVAMPIVDKKPQAIGSLVSYGRRYGLSACIGVSTEDDDAESAEARPDKIQKTGEVKTCEVCKKTVSDKESSISMPKFMKLLCYNCQKTYKLPAKVDKPVAEMKPKFVDKPPF